MDTSPRSEPGLHRLDQGLWRDAEVGVISAISAAWSRDGKWLAHADGNDLFLSDVNGSETRKLWTAPGYIRRIRFSPDSRHLRFDIFNSRSGRNLWDVGVDGSKPYLLLASAKAGHQECCGNWTRDGRFYLFESLTEQNISVVPEPGRMRLSWQSPPGPQSLTTGPVEMEYPVPSLDGKRLFVMGEQSQLQVQKAGSGEFRPYLTNLSPGSLAFSGTGKQIAYTDSLGRLWRSRLDNNDEKLQLTMPPLTAIFPSWSPDGKQIAFSRIWPGPTAQGVCNRYRGGYSTSLDS